MSFIKLAPSILSADLVLLKEQIKIVEDNGADFIHVDIMDGHFVPNITFGPVIVSTLRRITDLPLDVHLMISNPDLYVEQFAEAGATILTIHQELNAHLHRSLENIINCGAKAGIAINPATDFSTILPVIGEIDLILAMTVNPGFGAQKFIDLVLDKISALAALKKENGYTYLIEVDGGINPNTVPMVVKAGAEVLVAGHAIFGQKDIAKACSQLKEIAEKSLV